MSWIANARGPEGWGSYEISAHDGSLEFKPAKEPASLVFVPGFVDLHFHGAFGIDFMEADTDQLVQLCQRLEDEGYESVLLTTVTASLTDVKKAFAHAPDHQLIGGIHLEGPFISPAFPGAQPPEHILSSKESDRWQDIWQDPRLKLVTLAPEGADQMISQLAKSGVVVSMGHTNATYAEASHAISLGVTHATHTFNAMRPFHHREGGVLAAALLSDRVTCEVIYDRHHVSREAVELLKRCKPVDKVVAISDCTKAKGCPEGANLDMWGHQANVREGTIRLSDGTLAGSSASLKDVFFNLAQDFGFELACRLCCENPRKVLGLSEEARTWLLVDPSKERIISRHLKERGYQPE